VIKGQQGDKKACAFANLVNILLEKTK